MAGVLVWNLIGHARGQRDTASYGSRFEVSRSASDWRKRLSYERRCRVDPIASSDPTAETVVGLQSECQSSHSNLA
ncbi:unnamed protein product [Protopolystoma xenopodis]|uniref:Uncharacterized protein n=1 Tax=Protopolystoma xenopodis TaxID=117903 RepID=A0A3S5CV79_9PLAT|nr:unnamed protein product [Protopolystoma xenopodis]